jgi:hypothetical protein
VSSPDQLKAAHELQRRNADLDAAYADFEGSYVHRDLMAYLEDSYAMSMKIAGSEMENMDKKALHLQDAYAYGKVIAYIKDKRS